MFMNLCVHVHEDAVIETKTLPSEHDAFDTVSLLAPDGASCVAFFVQARDAQNVLRLADALRASALKYGAVDPVSPAVVEEAVAQ